MNIGATTYSFGNFILDLERYCLWRDGQQIKLRPKSFELLVYFVENQGRVLSKDELTKAIWPNSFVTEDSLVQCVIDIRRALNSDSRHYVKTLPRRGYLFEADVFENETAAVDVEDSSVRGNAKEPTEVNGSDGETPAEAHAEPTAPEEEARLATRSIRRWPAAILLTLPVIVVILALYSAPRTDAPDPLAVPLTSYPGFERNPAISPDGASVAFTWNGPTEDNFDIYVQPIDSGHPLRLTSDPAEETSPAWSPDGRTIAFLRRLEGQRRQLILVPSSGGPEHVLTETRSAVYGGGAASTLIMNLAWTPDGQWLTVPDGESSAAQSGLFLVSASTGSKRRLTQPPPGAHDENPAFRLDGRALAFSRVGGAEGGVYMLPLSEDLIALEPARRVAAGRNPVWTPDGLNLLYTDGGEANVISASNATNAESMKLGIPGTGELSLGRHLVYSSGSGGDTNIYRAETPWENSPPSSPQLLISSTRFENNPQYSPVDGKTIAFVSNRSGNAEIWISNADGSKPVQLTSMGPAGVWYPNWSPDGQQIVFHSRLEGQADLFTIAASGGPPKRLTSDPTNEALASYSRDGHWIYFNSGRSGQPEIWKIPAEGGKAARVTLNGGSMAMESTDGMSVFYVHHPENEIWQIPVAGGEAVKVTGEVAKDFAFAVSAKGIYYVAPPESPSRQTIQFHSFSSGTSRPVVVAERELGLGMGISPDSGFLIFTQRDRTGADLMLLRDFSLP